MKYQLMAILTIALFCSTVFAQHTPIKPGPQPSPSPPPPIPKAAKVKILPDLVVTGIEYQEASTVRLYVKNRGNAASGTCTLWVGLFLTSDLFDTNIFWEVPTPPLKPRQDWSVAVDIKPYTFPGHTFLAIADWLHQVEESDESNNTLLDKSKVIH